MLKFATAQIIAASLGDQQQSFTKAAHRATFNYDARPGFLYVRSRAISSRCNDNWDEFPADEIAGSFRTFVGKPVFVNHVNDNHRRARGVIIDAALHEDKNPDGTPDTWAEVLMEVDARSFPKLAKAILDGHVDRTSMGCDVAYSICSACGNRATTPAEYCAHIPRMKGQRIFRRTASGQRIGELVREICHGLGFFENSLLVEPPADPTAHFTGVDASGLGKQATKTAVAAEGLSWDQIGERHPGIYGDPEIHGEEAERADGPGIGEAANELAHDHKGDEGAENSSVHDLTFHRMNVDPYQIDHKRHGGPSDGRVAHAAEGYRDNPEQVPPLVLVHRHGVFQVADGHHRAEGAKLAQQKTVPAYVAFSPHSRKPFSDGSKAPFHGAETSSARPPQAPRAKKQQPTSGPGWEQHGLFGTAAKQATIDPSDFDTDDYEDDEEQHHPEVLPQPTQRSTPDTGRAGTPSRTPRELADAAFSAATPHETTPQIPDKWRRDRVGPEYKQDHVNNTPSGGRYQQDYAEQLQNKRERAVTHSQPFTPGMQSLNGLTTEAAGPAHPNPADHPWFKQTPLSHEHVLSHWDHATDEEKAQGKRWYPDAHLVAKSIAKLHPDIKDDKEASHKGAGLLSAYSPQQNWWANQHNAARSFHEGRALGKGEGLSIMAMHSNAAQKILDGEDHQKALKGPKTQDFAHLIEHGGNDEHGQPSNRVVIDRHALSVAAGRRLSSDEGNGAPIASRHYYEHAAQQYRTASAVISDREGRHVPPHEVQAVTWLTRQRLNGEGDATPGEKGRATVQRGHREKWKGLAGEHMPELKENGNSHVARVVAPEAIMDDGSISTVAYGEVKAPQDVDTLREENCPVCGDSDTYDGEQCHICGFISPPDQFRDPDLNAAKNMDLRKQVVDPSLIDDNGELQRVDSQGGPVGPDGQLQVGPDGKPLDPASDGQPELGPDGQPLDPNDPAAQQSMDAAGPGATDRNGDGMIDPSEIDADGNPLDPIDPGQGGQVAPRELPYWGQDHTGDFFTPGPDMPLRPGEPETPEGPQGLSGEDAHGMPIPGTPGDGVPDVFCPNCGFGADASPPQSQDLTDPQAASQGMDGIVAGDVCPSCQRGQLLTPGEINSNYSKAPAVERPAWS